MTTIHTTRRPRGLLRTLATLAANDTRLIGRDSFLVGILGFTLFIAVLLRLGLPWLAAEVAPSPDIDLDAAAFFPLLLGYIVVFQAAMLGGIMIGFVLLDERDDQTLQALLVTPLPLGAYLGYRVLVAVVMAWALVVAELLIINQAVLPLPVLALIAAVAAPTGGLAMLMLATLAGNKVEGFAQLKIIGGSGLLLFAAWFVPEPLQYLFGLYPPYWGVKAYWLAQAGDPAWLLAAAVGLVYMGVVVLLLARRFYNVVHQAA